MRAARMTTSRLCVERRPAWVDGGGRGLCDRQILAPVRVVAHAVSGAPLRSRWSDPNSTSSQPVGVPTDTDPAMPAFS
jgi:hypothetical protein